MFTEFRKSISSIFQERVTSPFWGALIFSWLIWNWKIAYLTFIIDQDKIQGNKIDYIVNNLSDIKHIIVYPLISAVLLLAVIPFFANGAFWLSLRFQRWRSEQKNMIERKQLLTFEQSILLRQEVLNQEKKFNSLLDSKNIEIEQLKKILEQSKNTNAFAKADTQIDEGNTIELANKIISNNILKSDFEIVTKYIQSSWRLTTDEVKSSSMSFFISNDLIEATTGQFYRFTMKGKLVLKKIIERQV